MNSIPRPLDNEVHLHSLTLSHTQTELTRLGSLLSTDETARAARLKSDSARKSFISGRGALREILGRYLGITPENVQIAVGDHGKPFLADRNCHLRFNLSHSGDMHLLAVASGFEVGVDIEIIEPGKPLADMARIAFSRLEQEELFSLPTPFLQTAAFYRCWVRKEACLKGCGRGFSLSGNSFDISPFNDGTTTLLNVCCGQSYWHIMDIGMPDGYCAALAVEARFSTLLPIVTRITSP